MSRLTGDLSGGTYVVTLDTLPGSQDPPPPPITLRPVTADSITPELAKQWIEAHLATACECIVNVLRARKDTIRLADMERVRAGLVAAK